MATLYELTAQEMELMSWLENEDVDKEMVADTLEGLQADIENKVDGYCRVLKTYEARILAIDAEKNRLDGLKIINQNAIERLKNRLKMAMETTGKKKIDTSLFKLSIRNNAESLDLVPAVEMLPEKYHVKQEDTINRKLLLDDIKAGIEVEGVTTKRTRSLLIK